MRQPLSLERPDELASVRLRTCGLLRMARRDAGDVDRAHRRDRETGGESTERRPPREEGDPGARGRR